MEEKIQALKSLINRESIRHVLRVMEKKLIPVVINKQFSKRNTVYIDAMSSKP